MIVNAYALLALFVIFLELGAGLALVGVAVRGLRRRRAAAAAAAGEDPLRHLLLLLLLLLSGLAAASIALWLLLLQSYVPTWSGVRCVVGVLKVGSRSLGAPGWLPGLAAATFWLRFGLLFGGGLALVLHVCGRDAPEGPPGRGHLAVVLAAGIVAVAGAVAESAWIVIPKAEQRLAAGCCTTVPGGPPGVDRAPMPSADAARLAYLFAGVALAAAALVVVHARRRSPRLGVLEVASPLAAAGALVLGLRFVADVVAPHRLGLPLHHCAWCLFADYPETFVGMALLFAPVFVLCWRALLLPLSPARGGVFRSTVTWLDRSALFGLLGAPAFFITEWVIP